MPRSKYDRDDDESFLDTTPDPPPTKPRRELPLWVVHITHNPIGAARARTDGFVCMGAVEVGDFRQFPTLQMMRAAIDKHYSQYEESKRARWAEDAMRFAFQVEPGDLLIYPISDEPDIMVGIAGEYEHRRNDEELVENDSANVIKVKWLATVPRSAFSQNAQRSFGSQFTIHSSAGYRDEVISILATRNIVPQK